MTNRPAHDLGGVPGFGRVNRSGPDTVFAREWERKVFGITFATLAQGIYNTDENRYARESMDAAEYRASPYWALWFAAVETNLDDRGIVSFLATDARARSIAEGSAAPLPDVRIPGLLADVRAAIREGVSPARVVDRPAKYRVGESVRARASNPTGHTRLPAYALGRPGVVTRVCGAYVLPDSNAHLQGECPEHVYTVRFDARDVWGERAERNAVVSLDAWESYLDPMSTG